MSQALGFPWWDAKEATRLTGSLKVCLVHIWEVWSQVIFSLHSTTSVVFLFPSQHLAHPKGVRGPPDSPGGTRFWVDTLYWEWAWNLGVWQPFISKVLRRTGQEPQVSGHTWTKRWASLTATPECLLEQWEMGDVLHRVLLNCFQLFLSAPLLPPILSVTSAQESCLLENIFQTNIINPEDGW